MYICKIKSAVYLFMRQKLKNNSMNKQPYPLTATERLYEKVKQSEEEVNSLRSSLQILLLDLKGGKDVTSELEFMLKYKRSYKSKISFEEWCEMEGYIAGFGRYSKDGKDYPAVEIKTKFYNNKKHN